MKQFKILITAALVLAAACSKTGDALEGALATLDYSVSLPEMATKAVADGKTVNKVVCAVFENGTEISALRQTIDMENGVAKENYRPSLYLGKTYKLVFWACYDGYYDVTDLTNIQAKTIAGNNEQADAFHYCADVEFKESGQTGAATLTRPLSKINVAVPAEGWNDLAQYARVTMTVCKSFDALSGEFSDAEQVTFTVPVSAASVNIGGSEYKRLAYNYLYPGDNTTVKVEISKTETFAEEDILVTVEKDNVPVNGNTQTHLTGDILRGNLDFSVSLSPSFATPDHEEKL